MTRQPSWCVGIDWATAAHQVCVINADGNELGNRSFPHSGSGLAAMADWIIKLTGPDPANVPVAIEVPHGPGTLRSCRNVGFPVHSINPLTQIHRFRGVGS